MFQNYGCQTLQTGLNPDSVVHEHGEPLIYILKKERTCSADVSNLRLSYFQKLQTKRTSMKYRL